MKTHWHIRHNHAFAHILPISLCLLAWMLIEGRANAQPPTRPVAPASPAPREARTPNGPSAAATSARQLLRAAAASLAERSGYEVQLRQRVRMMDQEMVGKGVYRQQIGADKKRRYRFDLTLRVGEESTSTQHVCDGRFLWQRRDYPGRRQIRRLDLQALSAAGQGGTRLNVNQDRHPGLTPGGLPELLGGIERRFQFEKPRAATVAKSPVWLLGGVWTAEDLQRLAPDSFSPKNTAKKPLDVKRLPAHLPTHVVVVLSRSREWPLFPHRIEYRRATTSTAQAIRETTPMVTMEFFNLRRGVAFDELEFRFQSGDQKIQDVTKEFLDQIAAREEETAKR